METEFNIPADKICAFCQNPFSSQRCDAKYCSNTCRQKAYFARWKSSASPHQKKKKQAQPSFNILSLIKPIVLLPPSFKLSDKDLFCHDDATRLEHLKETREIIEQMIEENKR